MRVFNEFNENKNVSLTLGTFDGIHIGHVAVIKSAVDFAQANALKSALITFKESPRRLLANEKSKYIISEEEKLSLVSNLGVDFAYEIDFSQELAFMSAEEYLKNIIAKYFSPAAISCGYDHRFGRGRTGGADFLRKMASVYKYEFFETPPQTVDGEIVGSSLIKQKLSAGLIESANKLLGRKFSIKGTIVRGNRIGGQIGFKTANIAYPNEIIKIPHGVYQAETEVRGKIYKSVANFGIRPTIKEENKKPVVEVHILDDFCSNIYGEKIIVRFIKKLRDEKRFDSLNELKDQINRDIEAVVESS
ncbi:MAG: bifunctional riboflavin kinase/FAD synthetase [Holosporaceae bacterium]|jgi:riboflavin kinase/FMN adenylyltransferase|nr:bifunctional riboflavin kinase/FAD synthetase [Holosporaceae bacterium]